MNLISIESAWLNFISLCQHSLLQDLPLPRAFKSHTNYEHMPGGEPAKPPAKYIYVARNPIRTLLYLCITTHEVLRFLNSLGIGMYSLNTLFLVKLRVDLGLIMF